MSDAVALVKAGALDYLEKPFDMGEFLSRIQRVLWEQAPSLGGDWEGALGAAPAIRRVERMVARMSGADTPVLITGGWGVGKKVLAQMIHDTSGACCRIWRAAPAGHPSACRRRPRHGWR